MLRIDKNWYMMGNEVTLLITNGVKYETEEEGIRVHYDGVEAFEVVTGERAKEIENEGDGSCIDEYHEYLVLHFENGDTSTFRNSHVDLFNH